MARFRRSKYCAIPNGTYSKIGMTIPYPTKYEKDEDVGCVALVRTRHVLCTRIATSALKKEPSKTTETSWIQNGTDSDVIPIEAMTSFGGSNSLSRKMVVRRYSMTAEGSNTK